MSMSKRYLFRSISGRCQDKWFDYLPVGFPNCFLCYLLTSLQNRSFTLFEISDWINLKLDWTSDSTLRSSEWKHSISLEKSRHLYQFLLRFHQMIWKKAVSIFGFIKHSKVLVYYEEHFTVIRPSLIILEIEEKAARFVAYELSQCVWIRCSWIRFFGSIAVVIADFCGE